MLINKTNIDIWYKQYLEQRAKTEKYVASRGGSARGIDVLTKAEFEMDFRSAAADDPTIGGTTLAKKMAKQEVFQRSWRQTESIAEAHKGYFGNQLSFEEKMAYRIGAKQELWDAISLERSGLRSQGYTNSAIKIMIGQQFFGSPA